MAAQKLQAIRGMEDILPDASPLWEKLEQACRDVFRQYGYANIRTPLVEPTALFVRGLGEVTDIVEKEMYVFNDRNEESLALRPEATAGIVRAAIEHNFLYNGPMRVWTDGPMFRYERPQKGRQRQFHQFDVEALGFEGPDVDAEQIVMLGRLWKALGIGPIELHVNSIGDAADRKVHREKLIAHFEQHAAVLDEDANKRLHTNPLRILDSKNPAMQAMIEAAPKLLDHLGDAARAHFEGVCRLLDDAGLAYKVNPRLVRGMDYYNRTVFEWVTDKIGAQSTITGGGRYDGLFEQLGGKPTPACGFAIGMERVLLTMQAFEVAARNAPDAFVAHAGEGAAREAWRVSEKLRDAGLAVVLGNGGSFKSQMKKADASGARFALILGDEELAEGKVTLKALRTEEAQARVSLEAAISRLGAP
ncbi:histidine--tRNA ligase [Usitatibacter palustris]|uniref:Histidine--tRNA ligase n=1 Tax=Usitatibacter palustris TaxID=2732487 RepID=A0A6M4H8R4_9PROT|nr:histidine--tRNA ligase [Usitatibacter palustris]QJR15702.1 Histidine--tRNA ligase [Usitatibacter palustris]